MKNNNIHNIKSSGFKVPKDYFSNLEDQIINQTKLGDAQDSGFKIPEGYLDSLEGAVLSKVSQNNNTKVVTLFSKRNLIYLSGIAAAVLLFFTLSFPKENNDLYANLDNEAIENYLLSEDISTYEIASLLTEEELIEDNFIDNNYTDENIESYLLENLDIEDLIIE